MFMLFVVFMMFIRIVELGIGRWDQFLRWLFEYFRKQFIFFFYLLLLNLVKVEGFLCYRGIIFFVVSFFWYSIIIFLLLLVRSWGFSLRGDEDWIFTFFFVFGLGKVVVKLRRQEVLLDIRGNIRGEGSWGIQGFVGFFFGVRSLVREVDIQIDVLQFSLISFRSDLLAWVFGILWLRIGMFYL